LNDILAWGHATAIREVNSELRRIGIRGKIKLVIDEFDALKTEERLRRVLELENFVLVQRPKAEEEIAVAAASIMARDMKDFWISDASRRLNLDLRKISAVEAREHDDAEHFAKVGYLKRR